MFHWKLNANDETGNYESISTNNGSQNIKLTASESRMADNLVTVLGDNAVAQIILNVRIKKAAMTTLYAQREVSRLLQMM